MKPKTIWKRSLTGLRNVSARAPVVTRGGILVSMTYDKGSFFEGVLMCLDQGIGAPRWEYVLAHVGGEPVVSVEGAVYWSSFEGSVHALTPNGEFRWKAPGTGTNIGTGCLTDGGGLVFCETGGNAKHTWCIDASTGDVRWQFRNGGHSYTPCYSGGRVVHATKLDGNRGIALHCLSTETGTEYWDMTSAAWMFRPIIHDDVVYIGADGSVRAYALADGRLLDSFDTHGARVTCPLLLQEERLYFGDNKGSLRSLSTITPTRQTLLPRWETSRVGEYDARAALSNERVAFLSNDGEVALLDAASGQLLQEFRHGKGDGGGGIVASNNSLVVAHGREVACYAP